MKCEDFRHQLKELIENHMEEVKVFDVEEDIILDSINVECDDGEWFAVQVTDLYSGEVC